MMKLTVSSLMICLISGLATAVFAQVAISEPFVIHVEKDDTPPFITVPEREVGRQMVFTVYDQSGIDTVWYDGRAISANQDTLYTWKKSISSATSYRVVAVDIKGNRAEETFVLDDESRSVRREPVAATNVQSVLMEDAEYYALLIGVDDYRDPLVHDLRRPVRDVANLYQILTQQYTFTPEKIGVLQNPTRLDIEQAFDRLKDSIGHTDNLLVFFAGHGYWNKHSKTGFWLPTDATQDKHFTYVRNSTIRDYLKEIDSRHTLLITDACFGGSIFSARGLDDPETQTYNELYKLRSRRAMTSGNLQKVPDESVFMDYMLDRLKANEDRYLSAEELFSRFRIAVIRNNPTNEGRAIIPQYGFIQDVGDEGGDFIFIRRQHSTQETGAPIGRRY